MSTKSFMKKIVLCALTVIFCVTLTCGFTACNKKVNINTDNPLSDTDIRPGTEERTVNYEIPTDEESIKELAYILYSIGNKTMVTVPYASYYETGTNMSKLGDDVLPLIFNIIDIRNNETGVHFRQQLQIINPDVEDITPLAKIMGAFSQTGKQWLVQAGETSNFYINTTKIDNKAHLFDWSKAEDNGKMNSDRKAIALHPIPYTSSGAKGKIDGLDQTTPVAETGTYWKYDEESGYSIPYIVDRGGRTIGFEKTDQHIFYSKGDDANKYDGNGQLIEEDYYNTIKSASITYNAELGYYEVYMQMDSTKDYTHKDTLWALQDDEGAKDKNARFTKLEVKFQLWDNGYFKRWEMWEDWNAPKAYGIVKMAAEQKYTATFSYEAVDADYSKYFVG